RHIAHISGGNVDILCSHFFLDELQYPKGDLLGSFHPCAIHCFDAKLKLPAVCFWQYIRSDENKCRDNNQHRGPEISAYPEFAAREDAFKHLQIPQLEPVKAALVSGVL